MEKRKKGQKELSEGEEEFKEYFPAIYNEIKKSEMELGQEELRTTAGSKKVRKFKGYQPKITDFICRCKTIEEAQEIVNFMLSRKEITKKEAEDISRQLNEEGLESFGPHRKPGYYERV